MFELCVALVAGSWTETRPQDFLDGVYSDLLYVSRRLMVEGANPSDSGAVEFVPRFDANRDGYPDLFSSAYIGYKARIWFGGPNGYSQSLYREYPTPVQYAGNCDMADLNLDGWPEFVVASGWSIPGPSSSRLFWGSAGSGGPDPNTWLNLTTTKCEALYIHDLDKNTYLDLIFGAEETLTSLRVFWGNPAGYSLDSSTTVGSRGWVSHNIEVADLNKDGYRDLIMTQSKVGTGQDSGGVWILWGDNTPRNFSDNPSQTLLNLGMDWHGITVADLNNDGWLDIVVSRWAVTSAVSVVYFSNAGSYSPANSITLPTSTCFGGSAAYDIDGDGWLDLVFFRGYNANLPVLIWHNSGAWPYFAVGDTARIGRQLTYAAGICGDFNCDGKPDIFANSGDTSFVFWGVQINGACDSVQKLSMMPGDYDHHGTFREPGNVYDRSGMEWYESGVFSEANLQAETRISWIAWDSVQAGSELRMYIRTRWDGSSPWSSWRQVTNGETVSEAPYFPARDIQYRAEFRWRNPAWLPWLERVNLSTSPLSSEEAASGSEGALRFGSGNGLVWVSWPGRDADVSLYSADGRRVGSKALVEGRVEFRGLRSGVYYLWVENQDKVVKEKVLVK
ncbi:MAG: FG-GAP repeat domain-containing protein [candidate division WOR-3 bacterium]